MEITILSELLERPVAYHAILAKALGNVPAAVMLSQGIFWHKKTPAEKDGWFWVTAEDWYEQTGITKESQATARKHLRASGIWEEKLIGVPAKTHYKLSLENIVAVISRYLETGKAVAVIYRNKKAGIPRTSDGKFRQQAAGENGNYTKTTKNIKDHTKTRERVKKQNASSPDIRRGAASPGLKTEGNEGYTFDQFWNDYAHKVGSKAKAEKAFAKLSEIDRGAIRDTVEIYKRATVTTDAGRVAGTTFKPLRQHPLTYLNGRMWETYTDSRAEAEQPTEYDEAYQKYVAWVEQNYAQAKRTCTNFSKTQFIEFKKTSVANIIGRESEMKFLKTAHESAGEKDAWTIYKKLVNDRMEARRI